MPTTMQEALEWGEFIASTNGVYRAALRRICAYCVTDIEVVPEKASRAGVDQNLRDRYMKLFSSSTLDAKKLAVDFAMSLLVYGNVFVSLEAKFTRYLECPECHAQLAFNDTTIKNKKLDLSFSNCKFRGFCPNCNKKKDFEYFDLYSEKPEDLYIRFWNPKDIELRYDYYTGESEIIWKIPHTYRSLISQGDLQAIKTCPKELIETIDNNEDLHFDKDAILHCKEGYLPGIESHGWGIPRSIVNFRAAWYWKLIESYNERLATDFIMPTRCLSPASGGSDSPADPLLSSGMGTFVSHMQRMIKQHERDPNAWLISPSPINYQAIGGDAARFLPKEQLEHGMNVLLTSTDIPVDMFTGTLQLQSAPTSLRLFESTWGGLISDLNRFLQFMVSRASFLMNEIPVCLRFKRIQHADDLTRQQAILQLGSAGEVSRTTTLGSVGLDKQEEMRLQLEEDRVMAEMQQQQQEDLETVQMFKELVPNGMQTGLSELQQQQQGPPPGGAPPGGAPPGGAPPAPGGPPMPGVTPIDQMLAQLGTLPTDTPEDVMAKAQTLAQQIYQAKATGQRASLRIQLKHKDPQLHAIVSGLLDDMDRQAEQQGKQMMMQQGGPPM